MKPPGIPGSTARPHDAAIRLTGLHKSFGTVQAVRGIDLTIAPGEVVAFLGPNGAGKSTTIDMVLGLTRPDSGSVSVFGEDPVPAVRAGRVGAMLQSGALLPDVTVKELVTTFAALHRHPLPVAEALRRAEISDIAGTATTKLSGGQSQRVRYALALVPDPDLLVLDEPTVAMDVEVRRAFWASMREFTESGRTVLFATHYLEEADDFADRVVVLAGGQIVADGTGAQIKATVTGRTISTVVDASPGDLAALPGVRGVELQGPRSVLQCTDSDTALRELLHRFADARDIEVRTGNLEDAFLALTAANTTAATATATGPTGPGTPRIGRQFRRSTKQMEHQS
jgi:ABC-2 type transport system ATP-binding protein